MIQQVPICLGAVNPFFLTHSDILPPQRACLLRPSGLILIPSRSFCDGPDHQTCLPTHWGNTVSETEYLLDQRAQYTLHRLDQYFYRGRIPR